MLRGDKVVLRAIEREDDRYFWALNNDLEVELLSSDEPPAPISLAAIGAHFDKRIDQQLPDHWFAIEADGRLIGACGLRGLDATGGSCVLGIRIGERAYWGKGFGRDAVSTLLEYGFRHLNMHRVWLTVLAANERAIRSYQACGFVKEALLRRHVWSDGDFRDEVIMGVLGAEWIDPRRTAQSTLGAPQADQG